MKSHNSVVLYIPICNITDFSMSCNPFLLLITHLMCHNLFFNVINTYVTNIFIYYKKLYPTVLNTLKEPLENIMLVIVGAVIIAPYLMVPRGTIIRR